MGGGRRVAEREENEIERGREEKDRRERKVSDRGEK